MNGIAQIFLLPGDYATVRKPTQIGTLLGSCVSVCLSNPYRNIAAMNHYLLPTAERNTELGRYGDTSTERILKTLMALDPDPSHYRAQLYGGGAVLGHLGALGQIGQRNVQIARQVLRDYGVRIAREEVGGTTGRRIDFFTDKQTVECHLLKGREACENRGADLRVLIVDDSQVVRRVLRSALDGAEGVQVVGEAVDPFHARELILQTNPDVITLDIEMPQMDGLTFLRHLMAHFPKPVVIVSSTAQRGSKAYVEAMASGACDVLDKNDLRLFCGMDDARNILVPMLRKAAQRGKDRGNNAISCG